MRNTSMSLPLGVMLIFCGVIRNGTASAQARDPRTIDQEMDHLTKELELISNEQKEIRPLLLERRQRIQVLFDQYPSTPRQALMKIHAISDDTHHEIEELLTDHQRQLTKLLRTGLT